MLRWSNMLEDLISRVTKVGGTMINNDQDETLTEKCELLLSTTGEATGLARSHEILEDYKNLNDEEKLDFFQTLLRDFGPDIQSLEDALNQWSKLGPKKDGSAQAARNIHFASEPRFQELVRRLNRAPDGTSALVKMREDLLAYTKKHPELRLLDRDMQHLFTSWFNRGFLSLEVIDWSTPAQILEKIITYEAVHEIQGWDDLRRRVAAKDRRLYAFFHASLTSDPLIFVEVALTDGTPSAIGSILSAERTALDAEDATTAVFYSISNCQTGLRGISFGNFLIKQVVEELQRELPNLNRFITMSPVPSLRKWATTDAKLDEEQQQLVSQLDEHMEKANTLPDDQVEYFQQSANTQLNQLAATYLLEAKHKSGGPYDPVSRFHLGNGARLEQINLWADCSKRGQAGSWGVMVNYEYDLTSIEQNHEALLSEGIISASAAVKKLQKKS